MFRVVCYVDYVSAFAVLSPQQDAAPETVRIVLLYRILCLL